MLIPLKAGPTLPIEAIALAVDLEARGFLLRCQNEQLFVSKRNATVALGLSPADREIIKKWKFHLLAVVAYCNTHKE